MALSDYTIIGPLCYQGKKDCDSAMCRRRWYRDEDGTQRMSPDCEGYHCSYCDTPCSMMGHKCDAAEAVLGEASRIARAGSPKEKQP